MTYTEFSAAHPLAEYRDAQKWHGYNFEPTPERLKQLGWWPTMWWEGVWEGRRYQAWLGQEDAGHEEIRFDYYEPSPEYRERMEQYWEGLRERRLRYD